MSSHETIPPELHETLRARARGPLPDHVELVADLYIIMRDGVRLCADMYRPKGVEDQLPVVLSVGPYIKELQMAPPLLTHSIEAGPTATLVENGYIHVIVTHRGAGQSQGQYAHCSEPEQVDMYDIVEWAGVQSWCDGNVAMLGDSHYAVNSIWGAIHQPPHLRCVVAFDAFSDFYRDMVYPGGLFRSSFVSKWLIDSLPQFQWPGPVEGRLPPTNQLQDFSQNPFDGPYWWERSPRMHFDRIETPVLHLVPRTGNHTRGQLVTFTQLKGPQKLAVLPPPDFAKEHWLFLESEPLKAYMVQWLDHWMRGADTAIVHEPDVAIYDVGTGEWHYEDVYPIPRTQWTKFYLTGAGVDGGGSISVDVPTGEQEPDSYRLPDWELVEAGKPVLEYQTEPLETPLRIWGPLSATLFAATTATDTAFFVILDDVAPDGGTTRLTYGVLKASFRDTDPDQSAPGQPFHPFDRRELPESGKIYDYQIEMRPIFHTIKTGHRLRCRIQSNDPSFMNFLHTIYNTEMMPWPARNSLFHDGLRPSHLLLPVVPDAESHREVSSPLSEVVWPIANLSWDAAQ